MNNNDKIVIENAKICIRNFSGKPDPFNGKTDRLFRLLLDEEAAEDIAKKGYNVKRFKPSEDNPLGNPYLKVFLRFDKVPPNIWLVTRNGKTRMTEETVGMLDYAEISNIDLIITPYDWTTPNGSGRKAYVRTMYVTVVEDEFAEKYSFED